MIDLTPQWNDLGLALGISKPHLDTYNLTHRNDPTRCMQETIHSWVKQVDDVKRYGHPSWKTLCKAVNQKAGGNNPAAAERIAQRHHK